MPRRDATQRRPPRKKRKRQPNGGSFQKGFDARRHLFDKEEARAAYQAGWDKMAAVSADALAWYCRKVKKAYRKGA